MTVLLLFVRPTKSTCLLIFSDHQPQIIFLKLCHYNLIQRPHKILISSSVIGSLNTNV